MNAVGSVLGEIDDREPAGSAVFLHTVNGSGIELLPYSRAEALLKQVAASTALHVTGDLASGFAWPHPGAHPRHNQSVIPLAAPAWPKLPYPTPVVMELWWPADQAGYRQVRSFLGLFNDPYDAYLTVCCLWGTAATGAGAEAAYLYGPDRRTVFRINDMALTCAQISARDVSRIVATASDRDTNFPLPDDSTPALAPPGVAEDPGQAQDGSP